MGETVYKAFKPDKLNYELLGNGDAHMHWHLFPRRLTEPNPRHPVWWTERNIMYSDEVKPDEATLRTMKFKLLDELKKLHKNIIRVGEF